MSCVRLGERGCFRRLSNEPHDRHDGRHVMTEELRVVTGQLERQPPRPTRIVGDLISPTENANGSGGAGASHSVLAVRVPPQRGELVCHYWLIQKEHHRIRRRSRIRCGARCQQLLSRGAQGAVCGADPGGVDQRHGPQRLVGQIGVEGGNLGQRHRQRGRQHPLRRELKVELPAILELDCDALKVAVAKPRDRSRALADIGGGQPQPEQRIRRASTSLRSRVPPQPLGAAPAVAPRVGPAPVLLRWAPGLGRRLSARRRSRSSDLPGTLASLRARQLEIGPARRSPLVVAEPCERLGLVLPARYLSGMKLAARWAMSAPDPSQQPPLVNVLEGAAGLPGHPALPPEHTFSPEVAEFPLTPAMSRS